MSNLFNRALYQIIPIGRPETSAQKTEVWLQYYDIFVRHAFGSYRNILKEIAFTDVMGDWLTFYNNMSLQYNINECDLKTRTLEQCQNTHPDEVSSTVYDVCTIQICSLKRFLTYHVLQRILREKSCNSLVLGFGNSTWTGQRNLLMATLLNQFMLMIVPTSWIWQEHGPDSNVKEGIVETLKVGNGDHM